MATDINRLRQQVMLGNIGGPMGGQNPFAQPPQQPNPTAGFQNPFGPPSPTGPLQENPFQPAVNPLIGMNAAAPTVSQVSGQSQTPTPTMAQDVDEMARAMNQFYTPEMRASNRLNTLLDNAPVRQEPNWARKLVASGMGMTAPPGKNIEAMEQTMYAPYLRDMAEWKEKTTPFGQAAQFENTANTQERTLAGQMAANVVATRKNRDLATAAEAKQAGLDKTNADKNEIAKIRAEAYDFKMRHPDWEWDVKGGRILVKEPGTNRVVDLGPSGYLSETDKINLESKARIAEIQERTKGAVEVKGTPSGGGTTGTTGTGGGKTNTLEDRRIAHDKMAEYHSTDPNMRRFIKKNGDVYSMIDRPVVSDGNMFGFGVVTQDDVDTYDALRQEIYPNYRPPTRPATTQVKPPAPPPGPTVNANPRGLEPRVIPDPRKIGGARTAEQAAMGEAAAKREAQRKYDEEIFVNEQLTNPNLPYRTRQALEARQKGFGQNAAAPQAPAAANPAGESTLRPGFIWVRNADGQAGQVPNQSDADLRRKGYTRIQ